MRWESRQNFCNDSTLTFLQQRCSLIYERSLHHYRWAFINNKIHVYFALKHMTSTPPFYFTNAPSSFSLEISKTCFAIYIINLYIFIPLRIAQTSTTPPPFNVLSMKINKKCMTVIWGYGFIHTQKEKKKKLIIMMIMQNGTK